MSAFCLLDADKYLATSEMFEDPIQSHVPPDLMKIMEASLCILICIKLLLFWLHQRTLPGRR